MTNEERESIQEVSVYQELHGFKQKYEDCQYSYDNLKKDLASSQHDLNKMRELYEETLYELNGFKNKNHEEVFQLKMEIHKLKLLNHQLLKFIHNEIEG